MNKYFQYGLFFISFLGGLVSPLFAAQTIYQIDPMHTFVLWHINHFGFSHPAGKWTASGELGIDKEKLENSKANVTIDVAHMITGLPELDKHLSGKIFFDVTKFPTATFVSDKVEVTNNQITKLHGILTIKGIAKPIWLDVKLNKEGKNPITENEAVGYSAHTTLKRSDFGIKTLLPGLGDEVKIDIELEAFVPKK